MSPHVSPASVRPPTLAQVSSPTGRFTGWWVGLVVICQVIWLIWCLREPLPNASRNGQGPQISRGLLLMVALPGPTPDLDWSDSILGSALDELSQWWRLGDRVPILAVAGLILAAIFGLGGVMLQLLDPDCRFARVWGPGLGPPIRFGIGAATLGAVVLGLGWWGWLGPTTARVLIGALALANLSVRRGWRSSSEEGRSAASQRIPWRSLWPLGFALPFLVPMFLGAMIPTIDFDALEYHLQGPKEFYLGGRIAFLPHNVYTSMPFGVEMLHLLAMYALDDWAVGALAGQVTLVGVAVMAAWAVGGLTARWAGTGSGVAAALAYLATPWIYRMGVLPYVEGPLCFFHAAALGAAVTAWNDSDSQEQGRAWSVVGLLAGGAMACKYPGLISAVIPFGLAAAAAAITRRHPASLVGFVLGVALVVSPWLLKNAVETGDPVYPLGYAVFGSHQWDETLDAKWRAAHGRKPITLAELGRALVDVAGRSDWQSPVYLAFAPLAWLARGRRGHAAVATAFLVWLFAGWWLLTHRLDRFWLPLLAPAAVLVGLGWNGMSQRVWKIARVAILGVCMSVGLVQSLSPLTGPTNWTTPLDDLRHSIPRLLDRELVEFAEALPPKARPLLVGEAAVFHLTVPIVYNTVFNRETLEVWTAGLDPVEAGRAVRDRGITHIFVDWNEIARYRSPGNYGYTDYVTPELFERWVQAGWLRRLRGVPGRGVEVFEVRSNSSPDLFPTETKP